MSNKLKLIIVGTISLLAIPLFIYFISMTRPRTSQPLNIPEIGGTPTPIELQGNPENTNEYEISSLQKTKIRSTTDDQIKEQYTILSEEPKGQVTIYKLESVMPGIVDEIRTQDNVVIFESTSTEISNPLPRKLTEIERVFGKPEKVVDNVGDGFYMSAYMYPDKGFVVFANRYTSTVYRIQRFIPMTVLQYERVYGEFLREGKQNKEYPDQP